MKSFAIFHCVKVFKNQDRIIYVKRKKGFGIGPLTPQAQMRRSDYGSKSKKDHDGGNDTLNLYSLRDDGGRAYSLSREIN